MPPSPKMIKKYESKWTGNLEVHKAAVTEKKGSKRFKFDDGFEEPDYEDDQKLQMGTTRQTASSQNRRRTPKIKPKKAEFNSKRIIINLFKTEYPLLERVATETMGWRISKYEDFSNTAWDLLWVDLGIDSVLLSSLRLY